MYFGVITSTHAYDFQLRYKIYVHTVVYYHTIRVLCLRSDEQYCYIWTYRGLHPVLRGKRPAIADTDRYFLNSCKFNKKPFGGERTDTPTDILPEGSARCVQSFDDSLDFAIRMTYRISLRSSSLWEPRHPLLKVVWHFALCVLRQKADRTFYRCHLAFAFTIEFMINASLFLYRMDMCSSTCASEED